MIVVLRFAHQLAPPVFALGLSRMNTHTTFEGLLFNCCPKDPVASQLPCDGTTSLECKVDNCLLGKMEASRPFLSLSVGYALNPKLPAWIELPTEVLAHIFQEMRWLRRVSAAARLVCTRWMRTHDQYLPSLILRAPPFNLSRLTTVRLVLDHYRTIAYTYYGMKSYWFASKFFGEMYAHEHIALRLVIFCCW